MARKSPDRIALDALDEALANVVDAAKSNISPAVTRRIRAGLEAHALATETARANTDPIATPRTMFDPSDPKTAGRMVAIALLAQPRIELARVESAYGSGVYAIYYEGDHPLYQAISGTETPIYVGKADPSARDASILDDPVPAMDDVHTAQFAALLRTLSKGMNRQIIIAVHEPPCSIISGAGRSARPAYEGNRDDECAGFMPSARLCDADAGYRSFPANSG